MCNRYRVTEAEAALTQRYGAEPIYPPDETYPPPGCCQTKCTGR